MKKQPLTNDFNRLPNDIKRLILGHLDFTTLLSAAQVCRDWCTIARHNVTWKYFHKNTRDLGIFIDADIESNGNPNIFETLLKNAIKKEIQRSRKKVEDCNRAKFSQMISIQNDVHSQTTPGLCNFYPFSLISIGVWNIFIEVKYAIKLAHINKKIEALDSKASQLGIF